MNLVLFRTRLTRHTRAAGVVTLACLWLSLGSQAANSSKREAVGSASPQTQQGCVDRWNQMRMSQENTIASIVANRRCSVTLAYTFTAASGGPKMCAPGQRVSGTARQCLDRQHAFVCVLNQYGAYACPSHANQSGGVDWNASLDRHGVLSLDHPPKTKPTTALPGWAATYPYKDGFILPWTSTGSLRAGLSLTEHRSSGLCSQASETTTAPGALRCYAARELYDPCFSPEPSWADGRAIAACAQAPGSTKFSRFVIRGRLSVK